ncbi:MAG TPA: nucleotidyltransferase family protein [Stenotrophomonas sp.]|nr:nucleotidyltransferase family protein [Stenotrophomonas sp.]
MSDDVVAVVLAAGGSQRLGYSKQLLRRNGETLLRRAARLAGNSGAGRVLVALGAQATQLRPQLQGLAVDVIEVPEWQQGLGASLARVQSALGQAQHRHVLVLGCDQPALASAHLQQLLDAARDGGSAFSAYAGVRGLPAVIAWASWSQARFGGDQGLRAAAREGPLQDSAHVTAPELALDLDTPADVAAAISLGWLDSPDGPD